MSKIILNHLTYLSVMSTDSPWVTAVRLVVVVSVLIIPVPHHPCVVDRLCTSDGKILSNIGESALLAGP